MLKFAVVEKQFQYKGHDCICTFCRNGYRWGYVSTTLHRGYSRFDIDCHCGLSFVGALPEAYAPKHAFYIGFDCGHVCDGVDPELAYKYGLINEQEREVALNAFIYLKGLPIRDVDYVANECKKIVDQLEEKKKHADSRTGKKKG